MATVRVNLCDVDLPNPLILASGILGTEAELMARVAQAGAGAITAKSCSLQPRAGHPNPTVLAWEHGLINAIGLANPGVQAEVEELKRTKTLIRPLGTALIASVFADTVEHFAQVAAQIAQAGPDLIEINISCPNVHDEFGTPFAADAGAAAEVTTAVKEATGSADGSRDGIPILVKLSPNVADIASVARAVEGAGADGITAINTLTGMIIDVHARRPILANRSGGLSGPAIRPLAVHCVYDIFQAVDLPIVGTGGVSSGRDAVEMIMAGATAVGIGSAVYDQGPEAFGRILDEMVALMAELGYEHVEEMRGAAHRELARAAR